MQDLNTIPSVGTFGEVARNANTNFSLLKIAVDLLEHSIEHSRGYFTSASALTTAFPSPAVGDWAIVEVSGSPVIYKCSTAGTWSNSGTAWAGGSVDLAEYAQKTELGAFGRELSGEIEDYNELNYSILDNGKFGTNNTYKHACVKVNEGEVYYLIGASASCRYAFATSSSISSGGNIPLVSGTSVVSMPQVSTYYKVVIPPGCFFLLFNSGGSYGTLCYKLGAEYTDRTIKLAAISETQSGLNVGDYYYNSRSDIKEIRKKTGDSTFTVIPFHPGAVYTYDSQLYIWDGNNLVTTGVGKSVKQYVFSGSVKKIGKNTISIVAIGLKDINGIARTVYADPSGHSEVVYNFSSSSYVVLTEEDLIAVKTSSAAILSTDFVLAVWVNGDFTGGALLPLLNKSEIDENIYNYFGEKTPVTTELKAITPSGKLGTAASPNAIYHIPVKRGDVVHVTASDEAGAFRIGFTSEYPPSVPNNTLVEGFADLGTGDIDVLVSSPLSGYFIASHVTTRYADMTLALEEPAEDGDIQISTSNTTAYHSDGSIYVYDIFVVASGRQRTIQIRDTIQPLESTFVYVLTSNDTVEAKLSSSLQPTDIILIRVSVSNGSFVYFGGVLYADYCKKTMFLGRNPFEGKKIVVTGGSSMEGYTVTGGPRASEIIGTKLGMTSKNYAIAGSSIGKHEDIVGYQVEYANVFYSFDEWQAAIQAGTLNSSKNYLVKDSDGVPGYHIYKYANGSWVVADASEFINHSAYNANYDEIYVSEEQWQADMSGGLLDTSKTYLVKDYDRRPFYHLYKYSNGVWSRYLPSGSLTSVDDAAKIPLVDRIRELDTDADVIIIDSGGNDWAHSWVPMGNDLSRDKTTFCGAMHLICQYLVATYPGKVIIWSSRPAAWRYSDASRTPSVLYDNFYTRWNSPNAMGYTNQDYANNQKMILRQYGIEYFDLGGKLGLSQHNRWWCGDEEGGGFYAHPGAQAQEIIADAWIREMLSFRV